MDYGTLVRTPSKVHDDLVEAGPGQYMTKSGCKVIIPKRYVEKQLANFVGSTFTLAIFAVVVGDKYYGVSLVDSVLRLSPTTVSERTYGDTKYLEFTFEPGAVVIPNTAMVCDNKLPYQIYNEFIAKGRIPWFMSYVDIGRIFDTSKDYANLNLHTNHAIFEMLAAVMARDPNQRNRYLRQSVTTKEELERADPVFVAFRNIQAQATNTTTKLMGSYFRDALASALVNPAVRLEGFEKLLRM
jgi:hypothetical protein